MHRWIVRGACMTAVVSGLAACGGGGGNESPRADAGPVRYHWQTFFRDGRALFLMSFEGGLVYGFYLSDFTAVEYPSYAYAGLFIARRPAGVPAGSPVSGVEHSFEEGAALPVQLTLAINEYGVALGSLTRSNAGTTSPIGGPESEVSGLATDTSRLSGDYAVQGRSVGGSLKFAARIAEGRLSSGAEGAAPSRRRCSHDRSATCTTSRLCSDRGACSVRAATPGMRSRPSAPTTCTSSWSRPRAGP
jgi:hypothetical protein